jgi:carbonic anhydrase/acetyltransferase-like protein (isoleucine patch superfamily)
MALLHACEVQDDSFIGKNATVLDGAVVESGAMVAAGAVVTPHKVVRRGELWAGKPAQKLRDPTKKDFESFRRNVAHVELAKAYRSDAVKAAE